MSEKEQDWQTPVGERYCQFLGEIGFTERYVTELNEYFVSSTSRHGVKRKKDRDQKAAEILDVSAITHRRWTRDKMTTLSKLEVALDKLLSFMHKGHHYNSDKCASWIVYGNASDDPRKNLASHSNPSTHKESEYWWITVEETCELAQDVIVASQKSGKPLPPYRSIEGSVRVIIYEIMSRELKKARENNLPTDSTNENLVEIIDSLLRLAVRGILGQTVASKSGSRFQ